MFLDLFSRLLRVGEEAPSFSLPDQDANLVRLEHFRGRNVLLVFYPGDNTPVCRKQLCELRDSHAMLAGLNTQVLGINPWDALSHRSFRSRNNLNFPLLVDRGGEVAKDYHATMMGFTRRTVYLVDTRGDIAFAQRGKPDPMTIVRELQRRRQQAGN